MLKRVIILAALFIASASFFQETFGGPGTSGTMPPPPRNQSGDQGDPDK